MPKEAVLQIRIDSALKEQAEQLYRELGTSFPEAVRVFARQSVMQRGMPFTPRTAYAPIGSSAGVFSAYVRPGLREKESQAFAENRARKQREALKRIFGKWKDDRTTEEIIRDIESSRTEGREVSL
ncbi:MAG: type II toxin-antitoxin system RelB/DinJ family antitoxin [Kiritimatiellae bacterium]|nr:type II toxin-antitoxin system RelB/DinJ family antitoxin [Kiritimatiellia bacterium]